MGCRLSKKSKCHVFATVRKRRSSTKSCKLVSEEKGEESEESCVYELEISNLNELSDSDASDLHEFNEEKERETDQDKDTETQKVESEGLPQQQEEVNTDREENPGVDKKYSSKQEEKPIESLDKGKAIANDEENLGESSQYKDDIAHEEVKQSELSKKGKYIIINEEAPKQSFPLGEPNTSNPDFRRDFYGGPKYSYRNSWNNNQNPNGDDINANTIIYMFSDDNPNSCFIM